MRLGLFLDPSCSTNMPNADNCYTSPELAFQHYRARDRNPCQLISIATESTLESSISPTKSKVTPTFDTSSSIPPDTTAQIDEIETQVVTLGDCNPQTPRNLSPYPLLRYANLSSMISLKNIQSGMPRVSH